jgi:hypothetical protein
MNMALVPEIAAEAKALVALAFRNRPIEDLNAGKSCPICFGKPEFAHICNDEIKTIMKSAVDALYRLLWPRQFDPEKYQRNVVFGIRYAAQWDDPELSSPAPEEIHPK